MNHIRLAVTLTALAFASSAVIAQTAPQAATLVFVTGDVAVKGSDGTSRNASRGMPIRSGETVDTGGGRAQMQMIDGAYISLQPQTTLKLDDYRLASNANEEQGVMSLLRGGLRTITGLIGKGVRQNYKLATPTATVGIRGTEYTATVDNGSRIRVANGVVAVCNDGGCLDVGSGQAAYAPNRTTKAILTAAVPLLPPQPVTPTVTAYQQGENRDSSGRVQFTEREPDKQMPDVVPPDNTPPIVPLASGNGGVGPSWSISGSGSTGAGLVGGMRTFDAQGRLTNLVDGSTSTTLGNATVAEFNSDGIIAWGRWSAGTSTYSPSGSITALHYFADTPGAAVPIVKAFTSFASTAPTITDPSTGALVAVGSTNSVTGTLNVNFASSSNGSLTYTLAIPVAGQTFNVAGSATQYVQTSFLGTSSTITSTGGACSGGCNGNIQYANAIMGTIVGTGNTRAGANYGFGSDLGNVAGTVVFK